LRHSVRCAFRVLRDGHGITGDLRALSELWTQRQLEYWLRSLMERYEAFRILTEAALRSAVGQLRLQANEAQLGDLMRAYLFPCPDVKPGLKSLKGISAAILSNGTPENVGIGRTAQCPRIVS
jgi:FMN phosphatase YigB (HAD superfamily)